MNETAWITDIQRSSLHDGPGVRTTFFFQGCNLHCAWCHNPETISTHPKLMTDLAKCIGCGRCQGVCQTESCTACGRCAAVCPTGARKLSGRQISLTDAIEAAARDLPFYGPDGGVTCSGGEPMLQVAFLVPFLRALKERGIHTAVDTAANLPWELYERVLPYTDLFLVDYKLADEEAHRHWTGVSRKQIAQNLRSFGACGKPLRIRVPIIPGVNDTEENLTAMAEELLASGITGPVDLLPFHRLGQRKYDALGIPYAFADALPPTAERMNELRAIVRHAGLTVN